MSTDFNWRTDDDHGWEEAPLGTDEDTGRQNRRLRWVYLPILLVLLVATGAVIYRQVSARVDRATAQIAGDVLSSYEVVRRATEGGDRELFNSVLSGRNDDWTDIQRRLVDQGNLFDRSVFNLPAVAPLPVLEENVTFSSNLQSAEVAVPVEYAVDVGNGVTESVSLVQTHVYRRGNTQRWLYAPPFDDFWGENETIRAGRLDVTFPTRDADIVRRLATDLDRRLSEACGLEDVGCPPDLLIGVTFSSDPRTLLDGRELETWFDQNVATTVPTPTLVGLPQNDAAYTALVRGYAALLVRALFTSIAGPACCDQPLLFQAVVDWHLDRLGLQPWPLGQEEYRRLMRLHVATAPDFSNFLAPFDPQRQGETWPAVYAMLAYMLRRRADLSPGSLLRTPVTPGAMWEYDLNDRRSWLLFISDRLDATGPNAGDLVTNVQSVDLLCTTGPEPRVTRYTLDLANGTHEDEIALDSEAYLFPLAGGERYVVVDPNAGATLFGTDGIPQGIRGVAVVGQRPIYALDTDLPDRFTIIYGGDGNAQAAAVFPDHCTEEGCAGEALPGLPIWSPDGRYAITLPIGDTEAPALIDDGAAILRTLDARTGAAAWIDETTFAVAVGDTLFRSGVRWDNSEPLHDLSESISTVTPSNYSRVAITHVVANSRAIFYTVTLDPNTSRSARAMLFRYDLGTGSVDLLTHQTDLDATYLDLAMAPDESEILTVARRNVPGREPPYVGEYTRWDTADLSRETWRSDVAPPPDLAYWSPAGEWLLIPGAEINRLVHRETGAIRAILTDTGADCYDATWQ